MNDLQREDNTEIMAVLGDSSRLSAVLSSEQLKQYDVYRRLQATRRRRQFESWRDASRQTLGPAPSNAM